MVVFGAKLSLSPRTYCR